MITSDVRELGRLMVLVPHPDDEILLAAGIIRQAVNDGMSPVVVMATNGDCGCPDLSKGRARLNEMLKGLDCLGLCASHAEFLGFADTGMPNADSFLWNLYHEKDGQRIHPSSCAAQTYGLLEKPEFHYRLTGEHGSYNRKTFLADLRELFRHYRPESILTTSLEDTHGDHSGLYLFVREALRRMHQESGFHPRLLVGVVHSFAGDERWPLRSGGMEGYTAPEGFGKAGGLCWERRISFSVPEEMRTKEMEKNLKYQALSQHETALEPDAVEFLHAFIKPEEIFWEVEY